MDMRIQYGDMNPYKDLPSSVATGMQLGMQYKQMKAKEGGNVNIPFSNPTERQQIDMQQAFGAEDKDLKALNDFHKNVKDLSPDEAKTIYSSMKNDILTTPLGKATADAVSNGKIKPEEITNVMNRAKAGAITNTEIELFKAKFKANGVDPSVIDAKINEVKNAQKQMDFAYETSVKSTLNGLLQFYQDPNQYSHDGKTSEEVKKAVDNEQSYIAELAKNPQNIKWLDDYVKTRGDILKGKAGGGSAKGFQPQYDEYGRAMTFNKDTGKYDYALDPQTGEPYKMNVPASQADVLGAALNNNMQNLGKKTQEPPPRNPQKKQEVKTESKVATDAVIKDYIKKYGKEKALEKLKADGYK